MYLRDISECVKSSSEATRYRVTLVCQICHRISDTLFQVMATAWFIFGTGRPHVSSPSGKPTIPCALNSPGCHMKRRKWCPLGGMVLSNCGIKTCAPYLFPVSLSIKCTVLSVFVLMDLFKLRILIKVVCNLMPETFMLFLLTSEETNRNNFLIFFYLIGYFAGLPAQRPWDSLTTEIRWEPFFRRYMASDWCRSRGRRALYHWATDTLFNNIFILISH